MDLVLEGIDAGDSLLIEAASSEFKAGFEGLKGSVQDFQKVVADVGLKGLIEPYQALQKQLDAVDLDKVPETFSYEQEIKMLKKPSGDSPPETMISSIAMNHDINVNACKDAVIIIGQYLEKFGQGLFTVGTQGIQMKGEFQELVKVDNFGLAMLGSGSDAKETLANLAQIDKPQDEEGLNELKAHWKPLWDVDQQGTDANWQKYIDLIDALRTNLPKAYEAAGLAIQQGKPSQEFQQEVPKKGSFAKLFGGLFKSKDTSKIDPKAVMGKDATDETGLMGLPFEKLNTLVSALLEMSQSASEAAQGAVEEINNNQEKNEKDEEVIAFEEKLIDLYDETKGDLQKSENAARALVAFEKILGKDTLVTEKNVKALDPIVLAKALKEKFSYEQDDIKRLFELLEIEFQSDEEDEAGNVKEFKKDEWAGFFGKGGESNMGDGAGQVIARGLEELGLLKLTESYQLLNEGVIEDLIAKIEGYTDIDDKLKQAVLKKLKKQGSIDWIKGKLEIQESVRLIDRWGRLAGIIKG